MTKQAVDPGQVPVPDHVRRSGKIAFWSAYVAPLAIYALVVLFAPLDILEKSPDALGWTTRIHEAVLGLPGHPDVFKQARTTAFPQVAMLATSLAVCICMLIAVTLGVKNLWHYEYTLAPFTPARKPQPFAALVVFPALGLFCMWSFFCVGGDPGFVPGLTTGNRAGYLLVSSFAMLACGTGIGAWPNQFLQFCHGLIPRKSV